MADESEGPRERKPTLMPTLPMGGEIHDVWRCEHCTDIHIALVCDGVFPNLLLLGGASADEWARRLMKFPEFKFEVEQLLKAEAEAKS